MEKINIHMTLDEYKAIRNDLVQLYINEDSNEKAEMLHNIYRGLHSWDFDKEAAK